MANEYIYLYLFNLFLVVLLFHDYLAIKNENKNGFFIEEKKERITRLLTDDEFINKYLGVIIQKWEENGKPKGISLEDYINEHYRTDKGKYEDIEEKIDIEDLKNLSLTDEEFFDKYIFDIIDDWEKNERPNGISLYQYLYDNYKKVQEDEKCAKEFVEKVIKMSNCIISCEWDRKKQEYTSCKEFVDREYRGKNNLQE